MKKMMMMLIMATVALTASAQNTLRDNGTFTLQPKVGIGIGMLSGEWKTYAGVDNKSRVGLVAGGEGEYYATEWLGIAAGLKDADVKDTCEKLNLSIPIGVSYEISDFVIDLRYNLGLSNTNKADDGNKLRSDLLQITLGYKFAL